MYWVGLMSLGKAKIFAILMMIASLPWLASCYDVPRGSKDRNDFTKLRTVTVNIPKRTKYITYVADTYETRQTGLMNVSEQDLPADHGMIFVFDTDQTLSFWMRNTIIPLDIAYIRSDGLIVKTYTMEPLNEAGYPSIEAAQYALEVRGGEFAKHGIVEGDHVDLPADLISH